MSVSATTPDKVTPRVLSPWLTFLFAASCGFVAANLYYGQPLAGPISANLGFSPAATGLIVTLTQIGYALGLLFIVPLGDLVENRRLVLVLTGLCAFALAGAAFAWAISSRSVGSSARSGPGSFSASATTPSSVRSRTGRLARSVSRSRSRSYSGR